MPIPQMLALGASLLPNIAQFFTGKKQMDRAKNLRPEDVAYHSPELSEMASMYRQGAKSNRMFDQSYMEGTAMRTAAGANYAATQSMSDPSKIAAAIGANNMYASDLLGHYAEQGRLMKEDRLGRYADVLNMKAQEGQANWDRFMNTKAAYEGAGMQNKYNAFKDASANLAGFAADIEPNPGGGIREWFRRLFNKGYTPQSPGTIVPGSINAQSTLATSSKSMPSAFPGKPGERVVYKFTKS